MGDSAWLHRISSFATSVRVSRLLSFRVSTCPVDAGTLGVCGTVTCLTDRGQNAGTEVWSDPAERP